MGENKVKYLNTALIISLFNILFCSLLISLLTFSFSDSGRGVFGKKIQDDLVTREEKGHLFTERALSELPDDFAILVEAYEILKDSYVDKDELDAEKLSQGAVKGMIDALDDPYSAFVSPEMADLEMSALKGKYQGIGAYVGIQDEQITVIAPMAGSPAEAANLQPGDAILEINGESTQEMNLTEAALKIQGPQGTSVILLILHEGEDEPVEIEIVRDEIKLDSVFWEIKDGIAHIRITSLLQTTSGELSSALKEIVDAGAAGIVLDLRNNPGGLLDAAVNVTSQFLASGTAVDIVDSEGNHSPLKVRSGGLATQLPLVVLVNGGSASGSEVIAGALQDYGRAKLAGSQTFGKGSVQTISSLTDGSSVHITIARWYTPYGRLIEGNGLTPDFALEITGDELLSWAFEYVKEQINTSSVTARS